VFRADTADFPAPGEPRFARVTAPAGAEPVDDEESAEALADLAAVWVQQSNGSCRVAAVAGTAEEAIGALAPGEVPAAEVDGAEAMAWMAWAAASGGAYGRRRGTPAGRFAAWWAVTALSGLEWPPDPGEAAAVVTNLRWLVWEPPGFVEGWRLHLAAEHPGEGLAWAVAAEDHLREAEAGDEAGPPRAGPAQS